MLTCSRAFANCDPQCSNEST